MAALLLLQEGGVDKPTVDELMLVEVWGEKETFGSCKWKGAGERNLVGGGVGSKDGCRGGWLGSRDEVDAEMVPGKGAWDGLWDGDK